MESVVIRAYAIPFFHSFQLLSEGEHNRRVLIYATAVHPSFDCLQAVANYFELLYNKQLNTYITKYKFFFVSGNIFC